MTGLGGDHEEALDAGVARVWRACEVVAPQTGTVEHVRDAVPTQHVHAVRVPLAADEHVLQQLRRLQLSPVAPATAEPLRAVSRNGHLQVS